MRGTAVRRAVAASVGLHALLAVALVLAHRFRPTPAPEPPRPGIDTRAPLRLDFAPPEPSVTAAPPPMPVSAADPPPSPAPAPATDPGLPLARTIVIPHALPPELLARLRKSSPASDVVEVPVTAGPLNPPTRPTPTAIQQVAGVGRADIAPPREPAAAQVHGALAAGQTIVYVLDASGSMGEWGKFDAARRALVATLKAQPETVRFQVVVYAGVALVPLPAPATGCVPATADNVTRMADSLRALPAPAGRSDHAAGLRAALALRPDIVLLFTDADDLPAAAFRGLLRHAGKPVAVCVARVGAGGVAAPRDWK